MRNKMSWLNTEKSLGTKSITEDFIDRRGNVTVYYNGRFIKKTEYQRRLEQSSNDKSKNVKRNKKVLHPLEIWYPFFLLHAQIELLKRMVL